MMVILQRSFEGVRLCRVEATPRASRPWKVKRPDNTLDPPTGLLSFYGCRLTADLVISIASMRCSRKCMPKSRKIRAGRED